MSTSNILKKLNSRDTQILPSVNTLTKIVFIALIVITVTFFVKNILAVIPPGTITEFKDKQSAIKTGNNQESWLNQATSSNLTIGINALVGDVHDDVLNGTATSWIPDGLIGLNTKAIAYLYNPPFSGIEYLASIKNNFLGKPSYAANNGFQGLSTILPLWKGFRNATYALFSIVFIIMGIMIMLRVKISPQAVITIQNSIPKLITALILVTFSYAIVGLLIDISYLIEALGISIILKASGNTGTTAMEIVKDPGFTGRLFGLVPIGAIGVIAGVIGLIITGVTAGSGWALGLIAFAIIFFGTLLVILYYGLKFFFNLIKCYINILIKTIIGPLEIALGAVPNMKMGFSSWLTDILANVLVFPISLIFLVMLKTIMDAVAASSNMWSPPGLEFLSGGKLLSVAIGFGGLMLVSKLPQMIPEFIFQLKPSPWGKAIGEGFTPYDKNARKIGSKGYNAAKTKWLDTNEGIDPDRQVKTGTYGGTGKIRGKLWEAANRARTWK